MDTSPICIITVGSKEEKGRALEQSVGAVWARLGFRNLIYNAQVTGEEIDVEGTHVVSGEKLKGQCKAHAKPADAPSLRLFFADVEKARGKVERLAGIFISQSGFTGTAIKWHEDLNEKQREYFKIQNGQEFAQHLKEAKRILDTDALIFKIASLTKLRIANLTLILSDRGEFWMVTLADTTNLKNYFCLVTGLGDIPSQTDVEYLISRIPGDKTTATRVSLAGRDSVIATLLRSEDRTISEIAAEAIESITDISAAVASLQNEGLIQVKSGKVSLRKEPDALVAIAKLSFANKREHDFMRSQYYSAALSQILIPYVEAKFVVTLEADEKQTLVRVLEISPGALWRAIAGDAEPFRNSEEHIRQLKIAPEKAAEYRALTRNRLFDDFAGDIISDTSGKERNLLLDYHGIILTKTDVHVKFAKRRELFLNLDVSWYRQLVKAAGPMKAGQLVSADGPGIFLEAADATMHMQEFDEAIKKYDSVIKEWPGAKEAFIAANNKGCCLLSLGQFDKAIEVFTPLLEAGEIRKNAISNLARAHAKLKDAANAERFLQTYKNEFKEAEDTTALEGEILKDLETNSLP